MQDAIRRKISAAVGDSAPELVLKNGKVVDLFCHRVLECDVAISCGEIVGLGSYSGPNEEDLGGRYLLPSLIDSHVHIEASMLTPAQYARLVAPFGVTTAIATPTAIASVAGEAGLRFMIQSAKTVPLDILYMLPAIPTGQSGINGGLDAITTRRLFAGGDFLGLGELRDSAALLACDPELMAKLASAKLVDGRVTGSDQKVLSACGAAGVRTAHEATTPQELQERLCRGVYVQIREETFEGHLKKLVSAITPHTLRRLLFCSGSSSVDDITKRGTVLHCVKEAVRLGIDPIDAVIMASLNAAECYGLDRRGAVAPGYIADLMVCDTLTDFSVQSVYKAGVPIAREGRALFNPPDSTDKKNVTATINLPAVTKEWFTPRQEQKLHTIAVSKGGTHLSLKRKGEERGEVLLGAVDRYSGQRRVALCYLCGFQLRGVAIAQSIAHNAHNIVAIGEHPEDMAVAVSALGRQGGVAVARDGKLCALLELPIGGLMSDRLAEDLCVEYRRLFETVRALGVTPISDLMILLSTSAMLERSGLHLTPDGLWDSLTGAFVD